MDYYIAAKTDKLNEECGIIGIYRNKPANTSVQTLKGLTALQHRGHESAGIAAGNDGVISCHKGAGFIDEALDKHILKELYGNISIGHVRYATAGERGLCTACLNGEYPY